MSRKIVEYLTVIGVTISELDTSINTALENGWELYGNPYYDGIHKHHAMVKYDDNEKHNKSRSVCFGED